MGRASRCHGMTARHFDDQNERARACWALRLFAIECSSGSMHIEDRTATRHTTSEPTGAAQNEPSLLAPGRRIPNRGLCLSAASTQGHYICPRRHP
jgi:hypothetical protein